MKSCQWGILCFACMMLVMLGVEPAFADVCKQVRPAWSPDDGPVSAFGEMVTRLFSGGGVFLIMATGLAIKVNRLMFSLVVATAWFVIAAVHQFVVYNPIGIDVPAHEIGCIGSPILAISLFVMIGFGLIVWQIINLRRQTV